MKGGVLPGGEQSEQVPVVLPARMPSGYNEKLAYCKCSMLGYAGIVVEGKAQSKHLTFLEILFKAGQRKRSLTKSGTSTLEHGSALIIGQITKDPVTKLRDLAWHCVTFELPCTVQNP